MFPQSLIVLNTTEGEVLAAVGNNTGRVIDVNIDDCGTNNGNGNGSAGNDKRFVSCNQPMSAFFTNAFGSVLLEDICGHLPVYIHGTGLFLVKPTLASAGGIKISEVLPGCGDSWLNPALG